MDLDKNQLLESLQSDHIGLQNEGPISEILDSINYSKYIKRLDPVNASLFFSSLLLNKKFYSNSFRIEFIIQSILSISNGSKKIDLITAKKMFEGVNGSMIQMFEDPSEEVMVSSVNFCDVTYEILEGTWVNNAFYLQRLLDPIEKTPDIEPFISLKKSIKILLQISKSVIKKSSLKVYEIGERAPRSSFVTGLSFNELDKRNILEIKNICEDSKYVEQFIFDFDSRFNLLNESINHNELHKKPILSYEGRNYLIYPNSIGLAIKSYIINFCKKKDVLNILLVQYQNFYLDYFTDKVWILKDIHHSQLYKTNNESIFQSISKIHAGLYVHLLYVFDDFEDVIEKGFNNTKKYNDSVKNEIHICINKSREFAINNKNFKQGLTLIISCGYGRSLTIPHFDDKYTDWYVEEISAPDLSVLSNVSDLNGLNFFRFLEGKKRLNDIGISFIYSGSLLNLYSWVKQNDYNFLPAERRDENMKYKDPLHVNIDPTSILDIRHEVYVSTDIKFIDNLYGNKIKIRKMGESALYKEDYYKTIYVSETDLKDDKLVGLIKNENLNFWVMSDNSRENRSLTKSIWEGLCYRVYDLSTIIEKSDYIRHIEWSYEFQDNMLQDNIPETPTIEDLLNRIFIKSEIKKDVLFIKSTFKTGFVFGFKHVKNIAERAIITSLIIGLNEHSDIFSIPIDGSIETIFRNDDGKSIHMFVAQEFTDYIRDSLPEPIRLDKLDDSNLKIGLAWICNKDIGTRIRGIKECSLYINNLIDNLWIRIKDILKKIDKEKIVIALLLNHESIRNDNNTWKRTFKAALSLHDNKEEVVKVYTEHLRTNNSCSLGSRVAIEMAICESIYNGNTPTILDLSMLISYSNLIHTLGCWSDAIKYQMVKAEIDISLIGDLLFDHTFLRSIVSPYGEKISISQLDHEVENYSKLFSEPEFIEKVEGTFDENFDKAWTEYYGFTIDDARYIIDGLEDIAINSNNAVLKLSIDDIYNLVDVDQSKINLFLDNSCLHERDHWENPTEGYSTNDIVPWKYKRKLSLVSKPILKIKNIYYISPALLRASYIYLIRNCYEGTFDSNRFRKKTLMNKWIGKIRNEVGHNFNKLVANELKSINFCTESDVLLTKILNEKLDKDYGDVDVLAWDYKTKNIYIIECKDLEIAKTYGEIAKQLYEFRGENRDNGKPDRLRKHLNRVQLLKKNINKLKKYIRIDGDIKIKSYLIFKTLVPLSFSNIKKLNSTEIIYFDEIKKISNK